MRTLVGVSIAGFVGFLSRTAIAFASPENRYLEYKEPMAANSGMNWLSTAAYVITLLIVFAVVLWAAYSVSQWFGGRMNRLQAANGAAIVGAVSLGGNRQVVMLKVGERILLLGVTDQQINLLQEVTDEEQVRQLLEQHRTAVQTNVADNLFSNQLLQLDDLEKHLPRFIRNRRNK